MADPTARLLALLALLQTGPERSGSDLAARLGVSSRTVRHDVERLRDLGYPVDATRGSVGGYRLGAGGKLPRCCSTMRKPWPSPWACGPQPGSPASRRPEHGRSPSSNRYCHRTCAPRSMRSARASTAPRRQRHRRPGPEVDAASLQAIARAIRDEEWLRFDYEGAPVLVEPYRLLTWVRRWYLVARDPQTDEWGTYRVDWMQLRMPTRRSFTPQPLPGGDYTASPCGPSP